MSAWLVCGLLEVTAFAQRLRKSAVSGCSDGPTENCISGDDSKTGGFESEDLDGILSEREVCKGLEDAKE